MLANRCGNLKQNVIMKNYLAFYGMVYYPSGGMDDLLGDFDTLDEAIEAITKKNNESDGGSWSYCWANVYSLQDRIEVYTA
jgi:hypothetical protein